MVPGPPGGRNDQRPHRPHELGPRVFRRGRWFAADLRPWDGGRPTLRNPSARGWPDRGSRTEDSETARRWAWAYVDHYRDEQKRKHLGLRGPGRPIAGARLEWIRHRERQKKSPKTVEGGSTATMHLEDFLPGRHVEDITSTDLQELFNSFLDEDYATTTLDTMRRHLFTFFRWAGVEPNPAAADRIELPDQPDWGARDWSNEQLVTIRAKANAIDEARDGKPPYMRRAVELALGTGTRQAELFALDRRDFSDARKAVRVVRQLDRSGGRKEKLKGKRARTAVVLPFTWTWVPVDAGLLLPGEDGGTIKVRRSRDLLLEVLEAAGFDESGVGWHRFRHTYARLFLEAGGWMDELQRSLGHASIKTTERIYGHFAPERAAHFAVSRIYGEGRRLRAI